MNLSCVLSIPASIPLRPLYPSAALCMGMKCLVVARVFRCKCANGFVAPPGSAGDANGYPKKKGKHILKNGSAGSGQMYPDERAAYSSSSMTGPCADTTPGPTCVSVRVECNSEGSDAEVSVNGRHFGQHHRHHRDADPDSTECTPCYLAHCQASHTSQHVLPIQSLGKCELQ